jgi:hypothetical protein
LVEGAVAETAGPVVAVDAGVSPWLAQPASSSAAMGSPTVALRAAVPLI